MKTVNDAKSFCKHIVDEYFKNHNYQLLGEVMADNITIIGTGAHEISLNSEEFKSALQFEEEEWEDNFVVENEWYHATELAPNLFVVIGQVDSRQDNDDMLVYRFISRFTFIVEYRDEQWVLLHVHQSVPDANQGNDESYPRQIIEESRAQLKKEIAQKTKELEMSNQQVIYNLKHDYLTGLLNRYYLQEAIALEMEQHPYGLILEVDIDHFKQVNDNNGHPYGDKVLLTLAKTMEESFSSGICGRIGGDEFIAYLPFDDNKFKNAKVIFDDFKNNWQKNITAINDNSITLSIGVACYPKHGNNYQVLWSNADKALYLSKNSGRNKITVYQA